MAKIRASAISASIAKEQREDQRAPPVRDTGLPPPAPKWQHSNPRSEITMKPRRNGVLWHR
jgi:hypothetical protein